MKNIIWDDTFYFIHCDSNYNWCRRHELGGEKSHKKIMGDESFLYNKILHVLITKIVYTQRT